MEFSLQVPGQIDILGKFTNKWYEFVNHFHCNQNGDGGSKTSLLLHFGAHTMKEIQIGHKLSLEELHRLNTSIETLEVGCLFQVVLCFVRHLFFSHCRHIGSTFEEFYTELRLLSDWCGFDDMVRDSFVKNQLIGNVQDKTARDVLLSLNNLSAGNVLDLCSVAEKKGLTIDVNLVNRYMMGQQRNTSHDFENKTKIKDYGWSSLQETQTQLNQSLNPSSLFRMDGQCSSGIGKSIIPLPDFKDKANHSYSDINYSVPGSVPDHSFFPNKVNPLMTYPLGNEAEMMNVTNFPPPYQSTTNYTTLPFQQEPLIPQPISSSSTLKKETEDKNDRKTAPKVVTKKVGVGDMVIDKNLRSLNTVANVNVNNENNDDLLSCFLDPNVESNSNSDTGEQKLSSYYGSKNDVNGIPPVFVSQQKAILRTSQMMEATGRTVDVYSCNFCIFSCAGKSGIVQHAKQVHKSLKCFVCTACNMKFPSKGQIDSHVRLKHLNIEEHKCQICDMVFASQSKLFLHLQGHAETRTVSCRVCSAMFTTEKLLSEHMSTVHPDTDRWICGICCQTFPLRKSLSDHIAEVHKDKDGEKVSRRFVCKLCDITFADKKSCEMHKRKFHRKAQMKKFPCDKCDHVCCSNANLISHMRIHTGEKPFMCEVCGKEFSQSSSLDKHTRIHTGEKPYKCQYCDLSFNTSSNRLVHERNHRKERPYVCEQCGKTYRNSYELKMHIDTHNEFRTKRFICDCGTAFDTKRKLKRHQVCHSGQKPYKCEICGAGFTRSENVKGHQKSQACRNRVLKVH